MIESRTEIALLRFDEEESILYITIREDISMDTDNLQSHYAEIRRITAGKRYAAFIDSTNYFSIDNDALKLSAQKEVIDQRIAAVHFNPGLANRMTANFFKNFHRPSIPIRLSTNREEAITWLKECLRNSTTAED